MPIEAVVFLGGISFAGGLNQLIWRVVRLLCPMNEMVAELGFHNFADGIYF